MSISKFEENIGGKRFQQLLIRLAARDKGPCFEQEKLLALYEKNVWNFLSITSLVFSLFEEITVISNKHFKLLMGFLHDVYERALSLSIISKLRHIKDRKENTKAKIIFILTWTHKQWKSDLPQG